MEKVDKFSQIHKDIDRYKDSDVFDNYELEEIERIVYKIIYDSKTDLNSVEIYAELDDDPDGSIISEQYRSYNKNAIINFNYYITLNSGSKLIVIFTFYTKLKIASFYLSLAEGGLKEVKDIEGNSEHTIFFEYNNYDEFNFIFNKLRNIENYYSKCFLTKGVY